MKTCGCGLTRRPLSRTPCHQRCSCSLPTHLKGVSPQASSPIRSTQTRVQNSTRKWVRWGHEIYIKGKNTAYCCHGNLGRHTVPSVQVCSQSKLAVWAGVWGTEWTSWQRPKVDKDVKASKSLEKGLWLNWWEKQQSHPLHIWVLNKQTCESSERSRVNVANFHFIVKYKRTYRTALTCAKEPCTPFESLYLQSPNRQQWVWVQTRTLVCLDPELELRFYSVLCVSSFQTTSNLLVCVWPGLVAFEASSCLD